MAKKRVSMRGMGADAFFNPPSEEKEEPVSQDESKTSSQPTDLPEIPQNSTSVDQLTNVPSLQETIIPVIQPIAIPESQETSEPVNQLTDKPVNQRTGKAAKQDLIKATYYIYPDQDMKLERIRLARRVRGERVDKSELIREAIDKLIE